MAKDVSSKTASNTNNSSSPISDQQKVPPLRIVLNTSGNQKSSSTAVAVTTQPPPAPQQQSQDLKRERAQDARTDGALKSGGRVRIKLGTNKQKSSTSSDSSDKTQADDATKSKSTIAERQDNNLLKEEINANFSHLRRITRRSQRSVQTVSNEDEESISSMTSTDENLNTTNNNNSDNNSGQDTAATVASSQQTNASSSSAQTNNNSSSSTSNSSSNNSNVETPRRYKRRKGENSESQLSEHDGLFGFQNYKLPTQNSFELYKNIRKQVDKKLKSLNTVHPKTPYGFRDYMLARGAYLLDGNKLGNGTNLFMNEDGGLHPIPMGKYHALRHRVNYSVPNRAKVPLGLPVNSPLYNLFMEQEKERYKMRMQHIKEREKLTLAAEQEIVRVYNQAAMAAVNQIEPFSACTMLKHQEVYNYIDSDGVTIQSREDDQLDQIKQEGVRTRRRQHEHISPAPTRKNSNTDDCQASETNQKDTTNKSPEQTISTDNSQKDAKNQSKESLKDETTKEKTVPETSKDEKLPPKGEGEEKVDEDNLKQGVVETATAKSEEDKVVDINETESSEKGKRIITEPSDPANSDKKVEEVINSKAECDIKQELMNDGKNPKEESKMEVTDKSKSAETKETQISIKETGGDDNQKESEKDKASTDRVDSSKSQPKQDEPNVGEVIGETTVANENNERAVPMDQDTTEGAEGQGPDCEHELTDDDRKAYNKEIFLSQLQDIDDKWDKIRNEMLIRHRNEAESLHAVQRLEWEWKTKEIGACDVRTTPIIDNTLVPKLNIYSQDY